MKKIHALFTLPDFMPTPEYAWTQCGLKVPRIQVTKELYFVTCKHCLRVLHALEII